MSLLLQRGIFVTRYKILTCLTDDLLLGGRGGGLFVARYPRGDIVVKEVP